jgi:nucleotide-binding universal stress UspA family protein
MFKNLLVPLDGSQLAESVLPVVTYLAKKTKATVTLVHIIEKNAPKEVHGQIHLQNPAQANQYLQEIARTTFSSDIPVKYHVHTAEVTRVSQSIAEHISELETDLVVMCTHGRGGVKDLLFGSIAQQVIAKGLVPVMLIRPGAISEKKPFHCQNILIPLDGQPVHEQGLLKIMDFGQLCQAAIHLIQVVPTFGTLSGEWATTSRLLPGSTTIILDMEVQNAEDYLNELLLKLKKTSLKVTVNVFRGDPADVIIEFAHKIEVDLIVLGTHAKIGTEAFWAGSVTPKICKTAQVPILLIPVNVI